MGGWARPRTLDQGDLLASDPYADWAFEMREKARLMVLDLLDLWTDAALDRGDLDEAGLGPSPQPVTLERTLAA